MNERLERGLMAGAVATCAASCITLLAIALQSEQILQPLSISLGLPAIEEVVSARRSTSVELTPFPAYALDLTEFWALRSSELETSDWDISISQLTFMAEPVATKDCATTYQFAIAPVSTANCSLGLPTKSFSQPSFQFSPLLTALELPTANPNQLLLDPAYQ